MNGLICWLEARDLQNGEMEWVDKSGNNNNGTLVGFKFDGTDGMLEDNYLRVGVGGRIDLPTPFSYKSCCTGIKFVNDEESSASCILSTCKPPSHSEDVLFQLRLSDGFLYNSGIESVEVDNYGRKNNDYHFWIIQSLKGTYGEDFYGKLVNFYIQINEIERNDYCLGYYPFGDTIIDFSCVLLYNRELTEEEFKHNMDYIKSLEVE